MGGRGDPGSEGLEDSGATSGTIVMLLGPFWVLISGLHANMLRAASRPYLSRGFQGATT